MYKLNKIHPVKVDDLIRVGRNADGGYVISSQQIEKTDFLLSFGINEDWSFEEAFLKKKTAVLYAFDYSVSASIFREKSLDNFVLMLFSLMRFKIAKAKNHGGRWKNLRRRSKDFKQFFQNKKQRFFIPQFLGETENEKFTCFETVFKNLPDTLKNQSIFIKMDIEKWEYRTLPQLKPFFSKINGLVVKFHDLDIAGNTFEDIIDIFSEHFAIAHIHANNAGGLIHNTNLPMLLEITFINKVLVQNADELSDKKYPVEGLDFPNLKRSDISLIF
ncbi:hypothetical protein FACS189430_11500 [Bacteroidia bacterium]|nr:hypothetical protein FACS189430_11500 [Bacteroidia bacterium]